MLSLQDPIHALHGVGPKLQAKLNHYGIAQIADLLFHLPRHYQDRSRLTAIAKLQAYQAALFEGNIVSCKLQFGKRRSLIILLEDDSAAIILRLFHFSKAQQAQLQPGYTLRCFGEARPGPAGAEAGT